MAANGRIRKILLFCVRFLVFVIVLTMLWWWLLPYYGYVLMQVSGGILKYLVGVPILAGRIVVPENSLLNTGTMMVFTLPQGEPGLPIAKLVTNMGPFLALVLATPAMRLARRLAVLALGAGILIAGHVIFIVTVLPLQDRLKAASEIPIAIIEFYLTLPFLLWIVLAYWDRIVNYLGKDLSDTDEEQD